MARNEIWKDIPGYEGLYRVSSLGRVKSMERVVISGSRTLRIRERILKSFNGDRYLIVGLCKCGKERRVQVHQLVAIVFLGHKPNGMGLVVNHINFNKTDNRPENLEIITHRENSSLRRLSNTSKYVGVFWSNGSKKWVAKIKIGKTSKILGYFEEEYDAHLAYQAALNKLKTPVPVP